jgi:hypothetical protein
MNWRLHGLRWSYCAFIAWSSLQTLLAAQAGLHIWASHATHALLLSSVELLAIAAFLVDRWALYAGVVLTVVFAIAAVLTVLEGQMPLRFLYFAATAIYLPAIIDRPRPVRTAKDGERAA